jgi:hypothetical protein
MATEKRGQATEKPVPEELGGLSEETIREIMSELPDEVDESETGEPAPETQPGDQEVDEPEVDESEPVDQGGEEDESEPQEQADTAKDQKTVPYQALKEEREKRKATSAKLEEQERVIKELQQRLTQLEKPPEAAKSATEAAEDEEQGSAYYHQLFEEAEKEFERREGRAPDELSGRDMVILNRIAGDIDTAVKSTYTRQMAEAQERQKIYVEFAKEVTAKPDFKEIVGFVTKRVDELPPIARDYLLAAYQRTETGKGSLEDIIAVRNFWEASEALYRLTQKATPEEASVATPPTTKAVKTAEKIEKMAAHPRSASIPATGTSGGALSVAELQRLLNSEDWDKIPPEVQRILKGG